MKKLILTGDDFGFSVPVNQAIEEAHRNGVLTATSLMVGAKAAGDAVERARRMPLLHVGLHITLVHGRPILPPEMVPDLVDAQGEFSTKLFSAGVKFFFLPKVRTQLEMEIRAQFQAFQNTGLPLDHVNAHNHMHVHPTIMGLILKTGRDFGLKAVRLPYEPIFLTRKLSFKKNLCQLANWIIISPWIMLLKARLLKENLFFNEFVFGLNNTGGMSADIVLDILGRLPKGVSEIYFHPAILPCPEFDRAMPGYQPGEEFLALTCQRVKNALMAFKIQPIAFRDL